MNTRAILFLVVIISCTTQSLFAETTTSEKPTTKNRRAHFRAQRKEQLDKRNKLPSKRFDDGKRGSVHYTFQHMSYQELEEGKQKLIQEKNYDVAIEYAKQQIAVATDTEVHLTPDILLEIADLLYAKQDYDKAWKAYAQWATQYPGANKIITSEIQKTQHILGTEITKAITLVQGAHQNDTERIICTQSEHAAFRAVDAAYRCTQDKDRDQTQTSATIELAEKFLKNKDRFKTHRVTVESIKTACYEKLMASELSICSFYRQQGNHAVVHTRLALLEEEYGTKFPPTKNFVLAYRTNHYGEQGDAKMEIPTTLITSTPKTHAADRF